MDISVVASLCGIVFGVTGATLGAMSYFRDKAKIVVTLKWDLKIVNNPTYDENKLWGMVTVTNVGRRPIFISAAALILPKKYDDVLVLFESLGGSKLGEGDQPATYFINQGDLEEFSKNWYKIHAEVQDSTGKNYSSKKVSKKNIPSWVKLKGIH